MNTMPPGSSYQRLPPPRPKSLNFDAAVSVRGPSGDVIPPETLERIERLDDVIFAALDGDPEALNASSKLYHSTSCSTPAELLDESREQYLKRAEAIVRHYTANPGETLGQTFAALEILNIVADE